MTRQPLRSSGLREVGPFTASKPSNSVRPSTRASERQTEDEVNMISIASLTLDTPLIPLKRKSRVPAKPFDFLALPSELRVQIYADFFDDIDEVLDLGPDNYKRIHKKLGLMRVCKQIRTEATHLFYSTQTFRIFPTYPGRYFKTKRPLLARLKPHQRACITSLELRLGPGWNAPPKGWAVNEALGLKDCVNVHKLNVFVECDPSDGFFKGFRRSEGFYEGFSRKLLTSILEEMPAVRAVEYDAWSSVKKSGAMMHGLLDVPAQFKGLLIQWGPECGWTDGDEEEQRASPDSNRPITTGMQSMSNQAFGSQNITVGA